jgi:hypothetical protein
MTCQIDRILKNLGIERLIKCSRVDRDIQHGYRVGDHVFDKILALKNNERCVPVNMKICLIHFHIFDIFLSSLLCSSAEDESVIEKQQKKDFISPF